MTEELELLHYGILRKSGRYPWGSGKNPYQRNRDFLGYVDDLKKQGLSEVEIARGLGLVTGKDISTTQLRALRAIAKNAVRAEQQSQALRLKDKGLSNVAIGNKMGINESSVRALLNPAMRERRDILTNTSEMLRETMKKSPYLDIGPGTHQTLGVGPTVLNTAVAMLREEGYLVYYVKVRQLGTGLDTTRKVLVPPGTPYSEVFRNRDKIGIVSKYSEDRGRSYLGLEPPRQIDSKRVEVRYAEEGGALKDGVIEIRPGVEELSLGHSKYAQVRIGVDGTHYVKGMAVYSDNLPDGVDMVFNTNKKRADIKNKLDALKPIADDPDNPFKSTVRQKHYISKDGKKELSALNILNEEGSWSDWSRTLSSQMLSKQKPDLAKRQLDLSYDIQREQLEEIKSLTNPVVRKKLLQTFADGADSSAVDLKALALPRTANHVILPVPEMKKNEIYAPNYRNGEKVVLIRHPHGGIFEIPELTVNNKQPQAKKLLGGAKDAVGIHPKTAEILSGADFDGDTVLVIPNNGRTVKTSKPLEGLKNFDPKTSYPGYPGMKKMQNTQTEMGVISNLITDMTIKGASTSEIASAVRHSMVVIDAEKHGLNYKQSYADNNIAQLKERYQNSRKGGASTLISRASAPLHVPHRKPRSVLDGGPIDKATGEKRYTPTGESYVHPKTGKLTVRTVKTTRMAEAKDAYSLVSSPSGTPIEFVYADHANRMKALANEARKEYLSTPSHKYSPSARKAYSQEVAALRARMNEASKRAPLERKAQALANAVVAAKRQANPDLDYKDVKKLGHQALTESRARLGLKKREFPISPKEWEAIQAGAISNNFLTDILNLADLDQIKKYAMPRTSQGMTAAKVARARSMLASGYTQAEVADALGVSTSTLYKALG